MSINVNPTANPTEHRRSDRQGDRHSRTEWQERAVSGAMAYQFLLTAPPTSVESERAFSSAGLLGTNLRSSLGDKTLDDLSFLRSNLKG